ncbi:hypothetical protein ACXC9Q_17540 [Kribbella sp. CWNU-51]
MTVPTSMNIVLCARLATSVTTILGGCGSDDGKQSAPSTSQSATVASTEASTADSNEPQATAPPATALDRDSLPYQPSG